MLEVPIKVPHKAEVLTSDSSSILDLPLIELDISKIPVPQEEAVEPSRPIWETEGELLFRRGNTSTYIIRRHKPGDEGVREFHRFDQYDPIEKHYYRSRKEYEEAQRIYLLGGQPERTIEVNSFGWGSREETVLIDNLQRDAS